jgi:hypothetical protein
MEQSQAQNENQNENQQLDQNQPNQINLANQEQQQTKKQILLKIQEAIPDQIKNDLKRTYVVKPFDFNNFSKSLTQLVLNNSEISYGLFDNQQDLLEKSGDILAKTLHKYWIVNDDIYNIYVENIN